MKQKFFLKISLLIILILLVGCNKGNEEVTWNTSDDFDRNSNALYDIYVDLSGNLGYIQISKDSNGDLIDEKKMYYNFKSKSKTLSTIIETSQGEIYGPVNSVSNPKYSDRIITIKDGKLEDEILLKNVVRPSEIISDIENHKAWIIGSPSIAAVFPKGNPTTIVDVKQDREMKTTFPFIKGIVGSFDIKDNNIYLYVYGARKSDYLDVPDSYIMQIDRVNHSTRILSKSDIDISNGSLKVAPNNRIYIANNSENEYKLSVFNIQGDFINNIKLEKPVHTMLIDNTGIAYIAHKDKDQMDDFAGSTITIFDTNSNRVIGEISGLNGPMDMKIVDSYLFVANMKLNSIAAIDINTKKIVKQIDLRGEAPYHLVVLKN